MDGRAASTIRSPACKPAGHAVQVIKTGRHAGDVVGVVRHLLHPVQQLHHQRVHGLETLLHARALLADVEDLLLGLVQNGRHRPALAG